MGNPIRMLSSLDSRRGRILFYCQPLPRAE
jgi:hypothetical protein